jgi:hypothetical protein
MLAMKRLALAGAALACLVTACAPRRQLCGGTPSCPPSSECVAGQCLPAAAGFPYAGTRRIVLPAADVALLDHDGRAGAVPPIFTMGRTHDAGTRLLLRFDFKLQPGTTVVRASLLLDRTDATTTEAPIALHAERVIGPWNPRTVSTSTAPPVEDVRLPRTRVDPGGPALVRIDVTDLARRWLRQDPADHGLVLVAENTTATGISFALGALTADEADVGDPLQPPRLEVYAR